MGTTFSLPRMAVRALEIFRQRSKEIDLVLLDKTMPDLDGEETFRAMKAIEP